MTLEKKPYYCSSRRTIEEREREITSLRLERENWGETMSGTLGIIVLSFPFVPQTYYLITFISTMFIGFRQCRPSTPLLFGIVKSIKCKIVMQNC